MQVGRVIDFIEVQAAVRGRRQEEAETDFRLGSQGAVGADGADASVANDRGDHSVGTDAKNDPIIKDEETPVPAEGHGLNAPEFRIAGGALVIADECLARTCEGSDDTVRTHSPDHEGIVVVGVLDGVRDVEASVRTGGQGGGNLGVQGDGGKYHGAGHRGGAATSIAEIEHLGCRGVAVMNVHGPVAKASRVDGKPFEGCGRFAQQGDFQEIP